MILAGVEAGGTKVVCVVADGDRVLDRTRIPTAEPGPTLAAVAGFLAAADPPPAAVGVAAFGPLDLRPGPGHGRLLSTPKPGWSGVDLLAPLRDALGVPVAVDTDVNAAALAEARWGAAAGLGDVAYLTVGTGVGVGALVGGRPVHGLVHPEAGHVAVPREPGDAFPGVCPFHGDCLEGMASGPALAARWGAPAETLRGDALDRAVALEAAYLASGLRTLVYTLAPARIVLGGGVSMLPGLVEAVRGALPGRLGGYPGLAEHLGPDFVVAAGLAQDAGVRGALALAETAAQLRP